MGSFSSKTKKSASNVKIINCTAYKILNEESSNSSAESPTSDDEECLDNTSILEANDDKDLAAKTQQPLLDKTDSERCNGDAPFEEESFCGASVNSRSLSLTTQVSPKGQLIPATDGDKLTLTYVDCRRENTLIRPNPILTRRHVGSELGAINSGKLGDKLKVRKTLEEQGLISDSRTDAKGEGILGELREVGILQQCGSKTDPAAGYLYSTGEPKRGPPQRLAHLPSSDVSLPCLDLSLPNRLRELKFGNKSPDIERISDIPMYEHKAKQLSPHKDSTASKLAVAPTHSMNGTQGRHEENIQTAFKLMNIDIL